MTFQSNNKKDYYKCLLKAFLQKRPSMLGHADRKRVKEITEKFYGNNIELEGELNGFVEWLSNIKEKVDGILLWGSYIDNREDDSSFSFSKVDIDRQRILTCGPSDFDALLIANENIEIPIVNKEYICLGKKLQKKGVIQQNIYRDIFVMQNSTLVEDLNRKTKRYLDCYLYAYFVNGLVLKTNPNVEKVFNYYASITNYSRSPKINAKNKYKRLMKYL